MKLYSSNNVFRAVLTSVLSIYSIFAWSQNISDIKIEGPDNNKIPFVKIGDVYHVVEGGKITSLTFSATATSEGKQEIKLKNVTCTYQGKKTTLTVANNGLSASVTGIAIGYNSNDLLSISAHYDYRNDEKDGKGALKDSTWHESSYSDSRTIKSYQVPEWKQSDGLDKVYSKADSRTISASKPQGGDTSGWKYTWDGAESSKDKYSINNPKGTVAGTTSTKLLVKNYAPDGKTVWFTGDEVQFNTFFYQAFATPSISLDQEYFYKTASTISISGIAGFTDYEYEWQGGANTDNKKGSFNPYNTEVTSKTSSSVSVAVTPLADDGTRLTDEKKTSNSLSITVFPKLALKKASSVSGDTKYMYVGDKAEFPARVPQDSYPVGFSYTYSWRIAGTTTEISTDKSITVNPTKTTSYNLILTVNDADGKQWARETLTNVWKVEVYNKPVYSFTQVMSAYGFKEPSATRRTTIDKDSTEFVIDSNNNVVKKTLLIIEGDQVKFLQPTKTGGGTTSSTDYTLKADDNTQASITTPFYSDKKKGKHTITINVKDDSRIQNAFEGTYTLELDVVVEPSLIENTNAQRQWKTLCGTTHQFNASDFITDYDYYEQYGNWELSWDPKNGEVEKGNSKVFEVGSDANSSEAVSKSYTLTVHYYSLGIERYRETMDLSYVAYVPPSIELKEILTTSQVTENNGDAHVEALSEDLNRNGNTSNVYSCLVGDKIALQMSKTGDGVGNDWEYEIINKDGKTESTKDSWDFVPTAAGSYEFTLHALNGKNTLSDPKEAYDGTFKVKYNVQPKLVYEPIDTNINMYYGQTATLHATKHEGGSDEGWTNKWIDNNATEYDRTYTASTQNEQKTYEVTYICEGIERIHRTQLFTINSVPRPEAQVAIDAIVAVHGDKEETKQTRISEFNVDLESTKTSDDEYILLSGDVLQFAYTPSSNDHWDIQTKIKGAPVSDNHYVAQYGKDGSYDEVTLIIDIKHGEGYIYEDAGLSKTYTRKFKVYTAPRLIGVPEVINVYPGQTGLSLEEGTHYSGGYKDGWTVGGGNGAASYEDVDTRTEKTENFSIQFVNEGITRYSEVKTMKAVIWPRPVVSVSDAITLYDAYGNKKSKRLTDLHQTYEGDAKKVGDSYAMVQGDSVYFNVNCENGIDDSWHYTISVAEGNDNYKVVSENSPYAFLPLKAGIYNVKIQYDNGNVGGAKANIPFEDSMERQYAVYPKPSMSDVLENRTIYLSESYTFSIPAKDGGHDAGWSFEWQDDKSTTTEKTLTPTSDTTVVNHAKYACDDFVRFEADKTYNLNVLAQPSYTAKQNVHQYSYITNSNVDVVKKDQTNKYASTDQNFDDVFELMVGDSVDMCILTKDGSDEWTITESINEKSIGNLDANKIGWFVPTQAGDYTIAFDIVNGQNEVVTPYQSHIERRFKVYGKPELLKNQAPIVSNPVHLTNGHNYTFNAVDDQGGHEAGWSYRWNIKGYDSSAQSVNKLNARSFSATNVDEKTMYTPTYTASYVLGGHERYRDSIAYDLVVWPEPKVTGLKLTLKDKNINKNYNNGKQIVFYDLKPDNTASIDVELYESDIVDIEYAVEGGYADANDAWTYSNGTNTTSLPLNNKETKAMSKGNHANFVAETLVNKEQKSEQTQFVITLKNELASSVKTDNNNWLQKDLKVNVKRWAIPEVHKNLKDSVSSVKWADANNSGKRVDVYAGNMNANNVNFNISHHYGNENINAGWKYTWALDDEQKSTSLDSWTYVPSVKAAYEDHKVTNTIKNFIKTVYDGQEYVNYGYDDSTVFWMRVWKKVDISNAITLIDENQKRDMTTSNLSIRSGNTMNVSVPAIKYGYTGGANPYKYDWSGNSLMANIDTKSESWSVTVPANANSTEMGYAKYTIRTDGVSNIGPSGKVWEQVDGSSREIKVYNRPATPTSLVIKGSGKSGTMVCTSEVSDDDLMNRQYFLVFGYVDGNNVHHDHVAKEQLEPGTVRWSSPYSTSETMQKAYVYSLWRYDDGVEVTSGLRMINSLDDNWDGSDYDPTTTRSVLAEYVTIPDAMEEVEVNDEMAASVLYYTMDGKLVNDLHKMPAGIYMRETLVNGVRSVKKFLKK